MDNYGQESLDIEDNMNSDYPASQGWTGFWFRGVTYFYRFTKSGLEMVKKGTFGEFLTKPTQLPTESRK